MSIHSDPTFSDRGDAESFEDRGQARYAVDVAVTVNSEHNFYAGYATNLSAGGFFVATHIIHPVGTRFDFSIQLDHQHIIKGVGEVRWLRPQGSDDTTPAGLGIQFLSVQGDGEHKIAEFLEKRQPLEPPAP